MSPQLEVRFVFFGAFLEHLVHLDNDENSAIDEDLGNKVENVSLEKCNASFYGSLLTVRLESDWQTLRWI
jgi:hypothetical protein